MTRVDIQELWLLERIHDKQKELEEQMAQLKLEESRLKTSAKVHETLDRIPAAADSVSTEPSESDIYQPQSDVRRSNLIKLKALPLSLSKKRSFSRPNRRRSSGC